MAITAAKAMVVAIEKGREMMEAIVALMAAMLTAMAAAVVWQ